MFIFVHQVIIKLPILVDLESYDIVLVLVTLTHLSLLHQVLLYAVNSCFQLRHVLLQPEYLLLVLMLSLFIRSQQLWYSLVILEYTQLLQLCILLCQHIIQVYLFTLKCLTFLSQVLISILQLFHELLHSSFFVLALFVLLGEFFAAHCSVAKFSGEYVLSLFAFWLEDFICVDKLRYFFQCLLILDLRVGYAAWYHWTSALLAHYFS